MKKLIILVLLLAGQNLYSQSLKLTHPTGGEKFLIGSDTLITWEGVPETEPIRIEFSNDNGLTWQTLTNSATGLKYNWNNIPNLPSDECMIRIRHIDTPDIEWEKSYGGDYYDRANSVQQTTDGGYIVVGYSNSHDGDVSENNGYFGYWILKLSSEGKLEWKQSFGGSDFDQGNAVQQTKDGGYIVAGFSKSLDGDVSRNNGYFDNWIIKLRSDGSLEWERSYGGSEWDEAHSVQQTKDGGYVVAGHSSSSDGDVSGNKGRQDYWIIKLRSDGRLEWEKSYGGSDWEEANSIQQTTDGGYIVTGFSSSSDGEVSKYKGQRDYWIIKLRSDGRLEWEKSYGGRGREEANSIQQTTDGGYIVAGFSDSSDVDVSENKGYEDYWILKLSSVGDLEWEKSYGGSYIDLAYSIQQTLDDGYIVAGWTGSSNDIIDYWIVKLYPDVEPAVQSDSSGLFSIENPSNVERLPISSNTAGINRITPNPADNNISISVIISELGQTSIAIYNIEGEKVSEIYAGEVATFGTYEFTSDISNLSNGTYYVIFQTPTVKDSQSIMIAR